MLIPQLSTATMDMLGTNGHAGHAHLTAPTTVLRPRSSRHRHTGHAHVQLVTAMMATTAMTAVTTMAVLIRSLHADHDARPAGCSLPSHLCDPIASSLLSSGKLRKCFIALHLPWAFRYRSGKPRITGGTLGVCGHKFRRCFSSERWPEQHVACPRNRIPLGSGQPECSSKPSVPLTLVHY